MIPCYKLEELLELQFGDYNMLAYTIIFSLIQFCQNVTGLEEALFMVSAGKRLTPAFEASIGESKIICCAKCSLTNWCLSANFNNSSRICEFVPLPSLAVQSYASVQENWNAYSTNGTVCIYLCCHCTACQCSPLRRKFMECYIIKPAQSLLIKHLVIGQR